MLDINRTPQTITTDCLKPAFYLSNSFEPILTAPDKPVNDSQLVDKPNNLQQTLPDANALSPVDNCNDSSRLADFSTIDHSSVTSTPQPTPTAPSTYHTQTGRPILKPSRYLGAVSAMKKGSKKKKNVTWPTLI